MLSLTNQDVQFIYLFTASYSIGEGPVGERETDPPLFERISPAFTTQPLHTRPKFPTTSTVRVPW